jgi:hypothetical protein
MNFANAGSPPASPRPPWLPLAVAGLWVAALAVLALTTANPVVLNWAQLRAARYIVTARVIDVATGRCEVQQQWTAGERLTTITVRNLAETGAEGGQVYLLPLVPAAGGEFDVAPTPLPKNRPLVYPATPEAIRQLRELHPR